MHVLLLDNRDSFVWNLAHAFGSLDCAIDVVRSDTVGVDQILSETGNRPDAIVLSPGPGRPEDAGCSVPLLQAMSEDESTVIPTLGVCLGHQAIAHAFGAEIDRSPPCHGKAWPIYHQDRWPFEGLENPLDLARYHSLAVRREQLPDVLEELAATEEGVIMALRHRRLPMLGFQFHPESFLSERGFELCRRFLASAGSWPSNGRFVEIDT
ncbi:MAG: aminodeoxychorismate/anthranilate synthase component II [Planctomycetota bacterium]